MLAMIIWSLFGIAFIILGIVTMKRKKAAGFWANVKVVEIENPEKYNKALGMLWCIYGLVFILLGLPLLAGQNSAWGIITILGAFVEVIATMIAYMKIESKYRKVIK